MAAFLNPLVCNPLQYYKSCIPGKLALDTHEIMRVKKINAISELIS
jgi:hypothetical protein